MTDYNFSYIPYYCEENIWYLSQDPRFKRYERKVVFISNEIHSCALWEQKAAHDPSEAVFWDYHVIFMCNNYSWQIWDLDTLIDMPVEIDNYVNRTFLRNNIIPNRFAPQFRIIEADEYIARFSSDRFHMRKKDGSWLAPPPPWPCITRNGGISLFEYIDMKDNSIGNIMSLAEFLKNFADVYPTP
ncbi:MAG: hypothetical protein WCB68_08880 [Pyrinomonadaceae bacterium]